MRRLKENKEVDEGLFTFSSCYARSSLGNATTYPGTHQEFKTEDYLSLSAFTIFFQKYIQIRIICVINRKLKITPIPLISCINSFYNNIQIVIFLISAQIKTENRDQNQ